MQGLNTTTVHAHAALFCVYGMLGIGLMLFYLRVLRVRDMWKERLLGWGCWGMNIGLMLVMVGSFLPVGLMQTWASVKYGYWDAVPNSSHRQRSKQSNGHGSSVTPCSH
jgi:nitric oxide reductase subunit B